MKLLFELSGEHPDLPFSELECVGTITERRNQIAVVECPDVAKTRRLALTHVIMEYLGECGPTPDDLETLLRDLAIKTEKPFVARVKKMNDSPVQATQLDLERLIGSGIDGPVSLSSPEEEYRAVFSGDHCYLGKVLCRIDRGSFAYRDPVRRPFFHPGVMMPIMARSLVNLSLVEEGDLFYDPFCGTGGGMLEADMLGVRVIGSDMDPVMIAGCRQNLPDSELASADATCLPMKDNSVDAVVTDLPYGQSVCIRAESMEKLYDRSLAEIRRVLKPGRRAVVVTHLDITEIAARYFTVLQFHNQRVHKSLTRRIMVLG